MPQLIEKFTPVVDSREKIPLTLDITTCNYPVVKHLHTGDYSILGLENIFCIERKKSVEEIVSNMFEKRMTSVIERLSIYVHKAIVCEFSYTDVLTFPLKSKIKNKTRVKGPFVSAWLNNLVIAKNIPVIYAGDQNKAAFITMQMMKTMWRIWTKNS